MVKHTSEGTVPWPRENAELYRAKGYWEEKPLGAHIHDIARRHPDKIALVDGADATRMTYAELTDRADAAAERLLDLGLKHDDRVLIVLPNGWQFVVLTLACFRAGIIPVMALPSHRRYELTFLGNLAEARAIVAADKIRDFDYQLLAADLRLEVPSMQWTLVSGTPQGENLCLEEILQPGNDPDGARERLDATAPSGADPALFLLSGGTTGLPKLITRTHNDYAYNIKVCSEVAELRHESVYMVSMPVSHNFPLACPGVLGALFQGARVVTLPSPNPNKAFPMIAAESVTITAIVPAVAQKWIDHQEENLTDQLSSLQVLQVGAPECLTSSHERSNQS